MLDVASVCLRDNLNYPKNDINGCKDRRDNAIQCQILCQKTKDCKTFTWLSNKVDKWDRKKCCLKSLSNPPVAEAFGMVSGPKYCRKSIMFDYRVGILGLSCFI